MKTCAVINDLSGFGKCSLVASLPVLACMGIEAKPLPTAVLSNQTAYDSYFMRDLSDDMPQFVAQWQKLNAYFDGIMTGFVANEKQFDSVFDFIHTFKKENTLLVVDPIMADDGALYDNYNLAMCDKVKQLCSIANIITPNCSELAILCDKPYTTDIATLTDYAKSLLNNSLQNVIVTGIVNGDKITNLCVSKNNSIALTSDYLPGSFSGTGDIFTAIICGEMLNGNTIECAVNKAQLFITKSIKSTPDWDCRNGISFEHYLGDLICNKD